jgi:hypothetical protein
LPKDEKHCSKTFALELKRRALMISGAQKGNAMPFKPNYRLQRADRNRAAQVRSEEKQRKKDEKAAQRRAERTTTVESPPDDDKDKGRGR